MLLLELACYKGCQPCVQQHLCAVHCSEAATEMSLQDINDDCGLCMMTPHPSLLGGGCRENGSQAAGVVPQLRILGVIQVRLRRRQLRLQQCNDKSAGQS